MKTETIMKCFKDAANAYAEVYGGIPDSFDTLKKFFEAALKDNTRQ